MFFAILCFDKPNHGELRERVRPEHLEYVRAHAEAFRFGGPMEDANGMITGAIFLIDIENHEKAAVFIEQEPYNRHGLYEAVILRRWHQTFPEIEPGANDGGASGAVLQLKSEGMWPKQA